jgi:hypothetical protein
MRPSGVVTPTGLCTLIRADMFVNISTFEWGKDINSAHNLDVERRKRSCSSCVEARVQ